MRNLGTLGTYVALGLGLIAKASPASLTLLTLIQAV
jgi:hypothetical protein